MNREAIQPWIEFLESSSSSGESSTLETSESSDDSLSDDEEIHESVSNSNFTETIEAYNDDNFKTHFRLKRTTLEELVVKYSLSDIFSTTNPRGKQKIDAKTEMFMFVWYISNTVTFRQLGNLFGVEKSTACSIVGRVSKWLVSIADEYIKWPQGEEIQQNCSKFEMKKRIKDVIGAIGCTHITIAAPREHKECYYNQSQNFSIVLQAVVDADKKFIDICCGEPGSLNDSSVLRKSELFRKAQTNYHQLFPCNTFLLGDSAYAASNWIVPPFKDFGRLTDQHKSFNVIHSSTRIVVENAFDLLKGRFRRVNKFTEQMNLNSVKEIIVGACVLHNLCILNDDNITLNEETTPSENTASQNSDSDNDELENNLPDNRRQRLFDYLCQQHIL